MSLVALIGALFLFLSPSPDTRQKYEVVLLGSLGEEDSITHAACYNNKGQVAGHSNVGESVWHGFIWSASSGMKDIGSLGHRWTQPEDINDNGSIVGHAYIEEKVNHAFLWAEGEGMVDLGTLGGREIYALVINNVGVIVGKAQLEDGLFNTRISEIFRELLTDRHLWP